MFGILDEGLAISIGQQRPEFEQAIEERIGSGRIGSYFTGCVGKCVAECGVLRISACFRVLFKSCPRYFCMRRDDNPVPVGAG